MKSRFMFQFWGSCFRFIFGVWPIRPSNPTWWGFIKLIKLIFYLNISAPCPKVCSMSCVLYNTMNQVLGRVKKIKKSFEKFHNRGGSFSTIIFFWFKMASSPPRLHRQILRWQNHVKAKIAHVAVKILHVAEKSGFWGGKNLLV